MYPTTYWKKYEKGINYIQSKNLIAKTNENWDFFLGEQWKGVQAGEERPVIMNFIHRDIMRKVTTIQSTTMAVNYANADGTSEYEEIYQKLSSHFSLCWEKANEDVLMRQTVKDAAITGDGLQYFGTADVSDVQRLDNTQVLYGDESETNIQKQPYVIIHQRESVASVKKQAAINGIDPEEIKLIVPDDTIEYTIGNTSEVEDDTMSDTHKVTTIIYMEKIDGVVNVAKCTKNVVYEKLHPLCQKNPDGSYGVGLTRYPIVKFSWEDRPNSARGVSLVGQQVNNQIEVNKTYVRRGMTTKMTAFPRLAYIEDLVNNPEELEKVGKPIALDGQDASSVNQIISYLNPAQTNDEPRKLSDDIMETTQELSGSGDTTTGNIDLNRVAASAIMVVNEKAESMLDEQKSKATMFVEDVAMLWAEMWVVYNPEGLTVIQEVEITDDRGMPRIEKIPITVDAQTLAKLNPVTRIDVSQDNSYSREAALQNLATYLDKGYISFEMFLKCVPDTAPIPKARLLQLLEEEKQKQMEQQAQMDNDPAVQGRLDAEADNMEEEE